MGRALIKLSSGSFIFVVVAVVLVVRSSVLGNQSFRDPQPIRLHHVRLHSYHLPPKKNQMTEKNRKWLRALLSCVWWFFWGEHWCQNTSYLNILWKVYYSGQYLAIFSFFCHLFVVPSNANSVALIELFSNANTTKKLQLHAVVPSAPIDELPLLVTFPKK